MDNRIKANGVRQFMQVTKIKDGPDYDQNQKLVYCRYSSLSGVALSLLMTLTKTWKPYNPIPSVTEMFEITGKAKSQISLAYKELVEVGELWKVKKPGRSARLYLNPELYWQGSLLSQVRFVAKLKKEIKHAQDKLLQLPEVASDNESLSPEELAELMGVEN